MGQTNSVAGAVPTLVGTVLDRRLVVEWIFRIAVAMEFVGHGAFGLMTMAAWVPYFAVAGGALGLAAHGEAFWEVVERGGAYAAPVLLILLQPVRHSRAASA